MTFVFCILNNKLKLKKRNQKQKRQSQSLMAELPERNV